MKSERSPASIDESFFFCPASDYVNKHNETGSNGQLSYEFIKHLSKARPRTDINAIVMGSHGVTSFDNVKVGVQFMRGYNNSRLKSLFFYIATFFKYRFSEKYRSSSIVQHLIPFSPGSSFNLFFLFRSSSKTYVLGPILGPHSNLASLADESTEGTATQLLGKPLSGLFRWLSVHTIRRADIVLFPDRYSYSSYKSYLKPDQRVGFVGFGISSDIHGSGLPRRQDLGPLRLLFIGRLTERKGCEYLIRALKRVRELRPDAKFGCLIVGSGPQLHGLRALCESLGLNDFVTFAGPVASNAEFNSLYEGCDIVCLPMLSDAWMVAKEALSHARPVIITDIGSHSEHVIDGFNGFLVPPKDPDAIATAILRLHDNRALLKELSKAAYSKALQSYDWDAIVSHYLSIVETG